MFVEGVGRFASNGSYAQYVAAHENLVARVPDNISDEEAAASTLVGLTGTWCLGWWCYLWWGCGGFNGSVVSSYY